ncbi:MULTISPECIES: SDR family NAD(P)-dependent oxidoreductase [unclassified Herbaspirillum]|uniref:SDR family NAD(P)-dependent oxidoreductase n=1 Tax=unclassified Herbaspirillum TaxID=2624150 RepID=UPI0011547F59|nr:MULTISPECIES: SDR family NAD(P)-dependent oxidoreductase [unclassified Herbaspirillum]MBB5392330.1 NAD(P)-dependent dehydrogenase (short-subunit alcohol dehydrogenase family) [Herbaspirillum sp. SJZ102]TQK05971.1 NAD(P)-dependent dehydrogenase (short-subunit alcohol dehydrogenase family) [Herbaspirillum sp. SJZ130]TQK12551.1 NAD(P)-dependent dehydrogenase (short-subunit alcohol dehydrogenase family) [Herbaspirillum sp. SJZ106]
MQLQGQAALVTGGASGLGAETVRQLARAGARVSILDVNAEAAQALAAELGCHAARCDITDSASVEAALDAAQAANGAPRILVNCAGIGGAKRMVGKDGSPMPLEDFSRIVNVNLIGTFNMIRLAAARMAAASPLEDGERGVIIATASVAAYDGQVGQAGYAASKGGITSMTLPLARDLAQYGIRVATIAPGLFLTPLLYKLPEEVQQSLAASIPFPKRLGKAEEFAQLALHIAGNLSLNGEVIRLDGALRLAPR